MNLTSTDRRVRDFVKSHPSVWTSDVAFGLDLGLLQPKSLEKLEAQGFIVSKNITKRNLKKHEA